MTFDERPVVERDGAGTGGAVHAPVAFGSVRSTIGHATPAVGSAGLTKFGGINANVVLGEHGRSAGSMRGSPSSRSAVRQVPVDRHASVGTHAPRVTGTPATAPAETLFFCAAARPEDLLARLANANVLAGSSLLAVPETAPLRIAIADPTRSRVELARRIIARGRPWRGRHDIWFTPSGLLADGRSKVAFTFPGVEPTLAPELEDVAAHFGIVQPDAPAATGIGERGMGIIRVGCLLVEVLERLGVEPDVIAGHGLGEWTAMIVSESVPPAAVDAFVGGLVADDLDLPDLVLLAERCLRGVSLGAPRIPMWSSITAQRFPSDSDGIREVATRLDTDAARFRELVENLYDDGVRVFVQPGLGGLTGVVGETLRDHDHLAVAAVDPNRSGLAQLTRVAAALWVEGADIRFERLVAPTLMPRISAKTESPLAKFMQDALPDPTEVSSTHPVPQASVRAGASTRRGGRPSTRPRPGRGRPPSDPNASSGPLQPQGPRRFGPAPTLPWRPEPRGALGGARPRGGQAGTR